MTRVVIRDLEKFPGLQPVSIILLYPGSHKKSTLQSTIALSTIEVEYMTLTEAIKRLFG